MFFFFFFETNVLYLFSWKAVCSSWSSESRHTLEIVKGKYLTPKRENFFIILIVWDASKQLLGLSTAQIKSKHNRLAVKVKLYDCSPFPCPWETYPFSCSSRKSICTRFSRRTIFAIFTLRSWDAWRTSFSLWNDRNNDWTSSTFFLFFLTCLVLNYVLYF